MSLSNSYYKALQEQGRVSVEHLRQEYRKPREGVHPCSFMDWRDSMSIGCRFEIQQQVDEKWTTDWCQEGHSGGTAGITFRAPDDFVLDATTYNEWIEMAKQYFESEGWVIIPERRMILCPYHAEWKNVFA